MAIAKLSPEVVGSVCWTAMYVHIADARLVSLNYLGCVQLILRSSFYDDVRKLAAPTRIAISKQIPREAHSTSMPIRCVMVTLPFDGKVLRQLDIATSQTIAIEIISGVGKVADDSTPVSLWALGDQMLIRVWQQKVRWICMHSCDPEAFRAALPPVLITA